MVSLPVRLHRRDEEAAPPEERSRGLELLERLIRPLSDESGTSLVVDAERVAELLDVTPRTARRALRTLADDGLAWPVPPARGAGAGRPRQLYRLVTERLSRDAG